MCFLSFFLSFLFQVHFYVLFFSLFLLCLILTRSPTSATVFALATGDGRIELWDLQRSTMDPQVSLFADGTVNDVFSEEGDPDGAYGAAAGSGAAPLAAQTALAFGPRTAVLVVGDARGRASVYEVQGVDLKQAGAPTPEQQAARLAAVMATAH